MLKKLTAILYNPSISAWLYNIVQIGSVIFLFPLILSHFTTVEVSFWLLLGTLTGLAMLADLGFSNTLIRCVSVYVAGRSDITESIQDDKLHDHQPNLKGLATVLKTIKKAYTYINIGCFFLITGFGILLCNNLFSMADDKMNLVYAFVITCIYSTIAVASSMWTSYAQGLGFISKINFAKMISGSLKLFFLIILLLFDIKLAILSLVLLLEAVFNYFYARNVVLNYFRKSTISSTFNKSTFDPEIFKILWRPTWRMAGIKIGGYLINQGNSIVIAQMPNPAVIASFMFTKKLLDFLMTISLVPFNVNINHIYTGFIKSDPDKFRRYISFVLFLALSIYLSGAFFLGTFGNALLHAINIKSFILATPTFVLLSFTLFLEMHHAMHAGIYMATNKVPFLLPALLSGGLILFFGFIFVDELSVLQLVLIQFIIQLAVNNWFPVYLSLKLLKWPFKEYYHQMPIYGCQELLIRLNRLKKR